VRALAAKGGDVIRRRHCLTTIAALVAAPRLAWADEAEEKRLQNRLELWANYAKRTRNLLVRTTTTRETSLLMEPMVVSGQLIFRAPDILLLRDDGLSGSTTVIDRGTLAIVPNQPRPGSGGPIVRDEAPAAVWLADRLVRTFAPGEGTELVADCRTEVPKRGYRLDLLPPRSSEIRTIVRSFTIHLDAVAGAVTEILIAEAQGDRIRIQLADHRQNVPDEDVTRLLDDVAKLRAAAG
jgi:hypothetical protein